MGNQNESLIFTMTMSSWMIKMKTEHLTIIMFCKYVANMQGGIHKVRTLYGVGVGTTKSLFLCTGVGGVVAATA